MISRPRTPVVRSPSPAGRNTAQISAAPSPSPIHFQHAYSPAPLGDDDYELPTFVSSPRQIPPSTLVAGSSVPAEARLNTVFAPVDGVVTPADEVSAAGHDSLGDARASGYIPLPTSDINAVLSDIIRFFFPHGGTTKDTTTRLQHFYPQIQKNAKLTWSSFVSKKLSRGPFFSQSKGTGRVNVYFLVDPASQPPQAGNLAVFQSSSVLLQPQQTADSATARYSLRPQPRQMEDATAFQLSASTSQPQEIKDSLTPRFVRILRLTEITSPQQSLRPAPQPCTFAPGIPTLIPEKPSPTSVFLYYSRSTGPCKPYGLAENLRASSRFANAWEMHLDNTSAAFPAPGRPPQENIFASHIDHSDASNAWHSRTFSQSIKFNEANQLFQLLPAGSHAYIMARGADCLPLESYELRDLFHENQRVTFHVRMYQDTSTLNLYLSPIYGHTLQLNPDRDPFLSGIRYGFQSYSSFIANSSRRVISQHSHGGLMPGTTVTDEFTSQVYLTHLFQPIVQAGHFMPDWIDAITGMLALRKSRPQLRTNVGRNSVPLAVSLLFSQIH